MVKDLILSGAGGGGGSGRTPVVTPDNLLSDDVVEFTLGICEGPIAGLIDGPKSFYLGDTPLVSASGDNNFNPFELHVYHGAADATLIRNSLGGQTSNIQVGVSLAQNTPVVRTTESTLRNSIDQLEIRLVFNQLYETNNDGDQLEGTAEFEINYRESGSTTWLPLYPDTPIITLTGKTTGGYAKDFVKGVPRVDNDWELQVIKHNIDNDPQKITNITWESVQAVTTEPRAYDNLAVVRGLGRSSDQFSSIPEFTGVYAALIVRVPTNYDPVTRYYDGAWDGTFKMAFTDNPAWCLYDMLIDENHGLKRFIPDLLVNRFSIYECAKWCDEFVPRPGGGYQPRFTYSDEINTERNGLEAIYYVAGVFGGVPVTDMNGTLSIKVDKPGTITQIFGPESVTEEGFNYQFSDIKQRPNDVTVTFMNPELNWKQDIRAIADEVSIQKNGRVPENIVAVGCLDVYEAQRRAYRRVIQANTEVMTVTFNTARAGLALELLDLIGIVDPDMNWGLSGRVKSYAAGVITLRDALYVPVGVDLTLSLQTPSGVYDLTVQSSVASTKELTVTSGIWPTDAPDRAQFALTSVAIGLVKPFRILNISESSDNPELMSITALEHNVNKFSDADNMTFSSGTIGYAGTFGNAPTVPTIAGVFSGDQYSEVSDEGVVNYRMLVELQRDSFNTNPRYVVRITDLVTNDVTEQLSSYPQVYFSNLRVGRTYSVVAALETAGVRGRFCDPVLHTIERRTNTNTSPVTGWVGNSGVGYITLDGPANTDADFKAFRIYAVVDGVDTPLTDVVAPTYSRLVPVGDTVDAYRVSVVNTRLQESPPSDPIVVFPQPLQIGDIQVADLVTPSGLTLQNTPGELTLSWGSVSGAVAYEVGVCNDNVSFLSIVTSGLFYTWNVTPNLLYFVRVRAIDPLGNYSPYSDVLSVLSAADTVPPATPTNFSVLPGFGAFILDWDMGTETDLHHYDIWESSTTGVPSTPSYSVGSNNVILNGYADGDQRFFAVSAVDTSGNRSGWTEVLSATTAAFTRLTLDQPTNAPTYTTTLNGAVADIRLTLTAVPGAVGYDVEVTMTGENPVIAYSGSTEFLFTVVPGTTGQARYRAKGPIGELSSWSAYGSFVAATDSTPPATPANFSIISGFGAFVLSWDLGTETDLHHYEIWESATNGTPGGATQTVTSNNVILNGYADGTQRFFAVAAVDTSGNRSPWTAVVSSTTTSLTRVTLPAPSGAPTYVTALNGALADIRLTLPAITGAVGYDVEVTITGSNPVVAYSGTTEFLFTGAPGATGQARYRAKGSLGELSNWSAYVSFTGARDTVAPATPKGFTATSGFNLIWLKWTSNTEADLDHYDVYESTTTTNPSAGTAATYSVLSNQLSRSGLADEVTRYYWIRAVDTSGNKSAWTARVTGTTLAPVAITTADVAGLIDATSFASGVVPVEIVSSLPTTGNFEGRQVMLTTDGKLYRYTSGAWTAAVAAGDVTGLLTANQIESLPASKLTGQIVAAQITNGTISADKIAADLQTFIENQGTSAAQDAAAAEIARLAAENAAAAAEAFKNETSTLKDDVDQSLATITTTSGVVAQAKLGSILASGNERFQFDLEGWTTEAGSYMTNLESYRRNGVLPVWIFDPNKNVTFGPCITFTRPTSVSVSINTVGYTCPANKPRFPVYSGGVRFIKTEASLNEVIGIAASLGSVDVEVTPRTGSVTIYHALDIAAGWWPAHGDYLSLVAWPAGTL